MMIIPQQKQLKILLIGDDCLDVYQYGTVDRINPEAPVPIFKFIHEEQRLGMAGNVLNNLETLGCEVDYLHTGTSIKTRLIDIRSKQHIVRIDEDEQCIPVTTRLVFDKSFDAIVISDYNKGTVSYELIEDLMKTYTCPIFIDTKKTDLKRFTGCWVKINQQEFSQITSECPNLIVTMGSFGVSWNSEIFPTPRVEVSDVCGAGDTFLASLAYQYLHNYNMPEAIKFAIKAGSLTVQHFGVYAPTLEEIENVK
jgi:bifunctional ADP-heptose synthase (sugar kinase/adenylyltransferase)